jgi:hypothetical protein
MDEKKVSELQEGMITIKEVYFGDRQVLIPRRTILTKEHIALLVAHRIESVCVSENIDFVQRFQEINERMDRKFSAFQDNPLMRHIADVAQKYFKEKIIKSFG